MAIIQNLEAFVQSYPAGLDSVTDLQLSQNENGRQIRFTIGGVTIPAGSVATISGTKPDGVVYSNTGTIEGADTVIFDEDVQMTAVFGTWYAKIRITNAGNTIASARVRFIIDKDPVDAGAIPSESQLDGLVAEAEEYAEAAGDAAERAAITYGSPLTASTAAAMTDVNRVYVYTGSESGYTYGNWYYYNGSAWVSGGVYNSAAVETDTTLTESGVPADAKATGDKIDELKDDFKQTTVLHADNLLPNFSLTAGKLPNIGTGGEVAVTGWNITDYIPLRPGEVYSWINISNSAFAFYDANKTFVDLRSNSDVCSSNKIIMPFKVPANIYFARFGVGDANIGKCVLSAYGMHYDARTVDKKLEDTAESAFSGLNARMIDVYKAGSHSPDSAMYQHGYITNAGAYDTYNIAKRASSKYLERYPFDIVFTPVSGALISYVIFNDDGTFTPSGQTMGNTPLTVPAGSKFILNIQGTADGTVEEICACVTGASKPVYELPDYYFANDYIGGKIDTIIDKSPLDGLQFVFLTDVHCRDNAGQSPYLIKYLKKYTNSVPFVVFGGDAMVTAVPDGVAPLDDARTWQTWMDIIDKPAVYQAQGNHDYLVKYYDDGVQTWYNAPLSICRQLLLGNLENANVVNAPGKTWFYVNIPTAKTRIIFLNDYDSPRNDVMHGYNGISVEQVGWVVNTALNDDDMRVIFVSHQTYDPDMEGENQTQLAGFQSLFTALANHTNFSYGALQKDFTNSNIKFVAHLCGHMHADASNVNNGVLTIQTTCDGLYGSGRTAGTITEQAFDVVTVDYTNSKLYTTRIGAGSDREFNI